ncbi:MAG: hypothetical protein J3R72DRAFT_472181 [Linnemannia gamsii]|nr:MAG: hypothetical protein J3R72DRAFT_472181 [Linnemannia gamsii]
MYPHNRDRRLFNTHQPLSVAASANTRESVASVEPVDQDVALPTLGTQRLRCAPKSGDSSLKQLDLFGSDGRLAKALKVVSGALRRLTIGWMYGVLPEDFSPAAALLQEGGKGRHGKDTEPDHIREDFGGVGLRLDRLK